MINRVRIFLLFLVGVSTPIESAILFRFVVPISMNKVVTALLLALVLGQRVVERRLNEGAYEAPADLDPAHEIELDRFGVVFVLTDRRFLAFTEKGLSGGMDDLVADAPIDEVVLRIHEGGRGPGKHRAYHLTLPDGRFLIRQTMGLIGPVKKMANAFDEAYVASGGKPG